MEAVTTFRELFEMRETDPDVWLAPNMHYPWGRVYGGQVAAQGLYAAAQTVEAAYLPHSMHVYFIRQGISDEPITYEVDRIRNGRSFVTRRVLARQAGGVMLNLSVSFQRPEDEPESLTIAMPDDVAFDPDAPEDSFVPPMVRKSDPEARARAWVRIGDEYTPSPLMEAVAHTFASDDLPTEAVMYAHPLGRPDFSAPESERTYFGASLDHAVWFHDLTPASEWTLHDFRSSGVRGGRGVAQGDLWSSDGRHIATVAQEVVLRVAR